MKIIEACHGKAIELKAGESLKVINIHGSQVVDLWAWNGSNLNEYLSLEATRVWSQRLNPQLGDTLVTNMRNPILTIVQDTSPGIHDSFMACCDLPRYHRLGVKGYHRNCFDNMLESVSELGYEVPNPTLASLNVFMNIAVLDDGISLETRPVETKAGDYTTFRAEMDCIVSLSSCPQDIVKIQSDVENKPNDIGYEILDQEFSNFAIKSAWIPEYAKD